jgi:hypothetical protein
MPDLVLAAYCAAAGSGIAVLATLWGQRRAERETPKNNGDDRGTTGNNREAVTGRPEKGRTVSGAFLDTYTEGSGGIPPSPIVIVLRSTNSFYTKDLSISGDLRLCTYSCTFVHGDSQACLPLSEDGGGVSAGSAFTSGVSVTGSTIGRGSSSDTRSVPIVKKHWPWARR